MISDQPVLQGITRLTGLSYVRTRCCHGLAQWIVSRSHDPRDLPNFLVNGLFRMKPIALARCVLISTLVTLAACGSDSTTGAPAKPALVRIVNSVFQYTDATNAASKTQPRSIDMLIDSSAAAPSLLAIAQTSVATPTGADASLYEPVTPGVHSFVARLAGGSGPLSSFYTNANSTEYLPRQYLTSGIPYTVVVAGIVPVTAASGAAQLLTPPTAAPFAIVTNDPFSPPMVNGKYQARFRLINAAPFATATGLGATVSMYLTPGTTAPATLTGLTASALAVYRNASIYVNADAGPYTLTVAVGSTILAQAAVTLGSGEVRTFILQSKQYAAVPSTANHVLQSLLDSQY